MKTAISANDTASISITAAWVAIAGAGAVLLLLAGLHVLSPEFDPSFRVVSEYANGRYSWVLSVMFAAWALSSWGKKGTQFFFPSTAVWWGGPTTSAWAMSAASTSG
jgi:hypothetical protein